MRRVLRSLVWRSFWVNYSDAGCNLDMHGKDIVYLHAMPDDPSQKQLLNLTQALESAMAAAGVSVNHARKSLFHMTLARVKRSYSVEAVATVVDRLRNNFAGLGLQLLMCRFEALGEVFEAQDGCLS